MGLIYNQMLAEIIKDHDMLAPDKPLEDYLKASEELFKKEYMLGDLLFYTNICALLKRLDIQSEYFDAKLMLAHRLDQVFGIHEFEEKSNEGVDE